MTKRIAPSILSADMTRLGEEVQAVLDAGADMIHFDVMDNHYVPNLTLGPLVCSALVKRFPMTPFDVHLMVTPVDDLIVEFAKAGARRISIHPDASIHLDRSLSLIKQHGCEAGLALNPSTSPDCLKWVSQRLDFVLVMTVNPGFGGQSLIPQVIDKIRWIHQHYPNLSIMVDGGVSEHNIAELAKAGVSDFVAGSAIFHSKSYQQTIQAMRNQLS